MHSSKYEAARLSNKRAADSLLARDEGKHKAATKDPNADTSQQVAEKVRREGWHKVQ